MKSHRDRDEFAAFINTAAVLCFLVVVGLLSVVLPKPRMSEQEKRDLSPLPVFSVPTALSGAYARDFSLFFADGFPGRDRLVASAGLLQDFSGITYGGLTLHQGAESAPPAVTPPTRPPDSPSEPPTVPAEPGSPAGSGAASSVLLPAAPNAAPEEDVAPERAGPILVYNGKGYQVFGGGEAAGAQYAVAVNAYHRTLGEGVQVYNLVVPSAIAFGLPERYQNMTAPEHPRIESIYSMLDEGVIGVDIYDSLEAHKQEYIYFGTDHHWTVYGAYLAYADFIRAAGMEPIPLDQMEKRTLGYDFYGTYYSQTQDGKLRRSPDTVDYFMISEPHTALTYRRGSPYNGVQMPLLAEYAEGVNGYSVFLHGDFPLVKVTTENKNGRRIAVVKESFGNAFAPFLVNHYEEVYIVDERYFEVGLVQFIRDNNINELLIINNIFAAHTGYHINRLGTIMYQSFPPPAPPAASSAAPADAEAPQASQVAPPAPAPEASAEAEQTQTDQPAVASDPPGAEGDEA